jgi:type VI secretion system protein ImpG
MPAPDSDFLRCYLEELSYLRRMGQRFAQEHPGIARRLELQADECPDPHVERLIESFAFLTARIQSDLENDFPEIATELLDVLYPQYLNPVPSMTIARFDPLPTLTEGARVDRGTPLFVNTTEGDLCRFRTSYPLMLWPIEVTDAKFVEATRYTYASEPRPAAVLELTLQSLGATFEELGVDSLRFYLHGDMVVNRLYSLLFEGAERKVAVVPHGALEVPASPYLPIAQVGFGEDEAVIQQDDGAHPAYRLLQEYFAFEEKFHFFEIRGLRGVARGTTIDLLFLLDREPPGRILIGPESFVLGCTPVVNLFEKTSEPIRVDHRRTEYQLVADRRRERSTAIHSIRSVSGSSDHGVKSRHYAPYYSYTHAMGKQAQSAFWHARRSPALRANGSGIEHYLSFHDSDFDAALQADEVVFAHLWCTNGQLAAELPAGSVLQSDRALPVKAKQGVVTLRKPTRQIEPALGGESLWRLVSHLSLNYLSLDGEKAVDAMREILLLYSDPDSRAQRQRIDGIRSLKSEKIVRRVPERSANGFCRGTRVTIGLDESLYTTNAAYLFATVLSHFLGLHASINSFTQLVVRRAGDDRDAASEKRKGQAWPLMVGGRAVL